MVSGRAVALLGVILLGLVATLSIFDAHPKELLWLQSLPVYKFASGCALATYIAYQWRLSYFRWAAKRRGGVTSYRRHQIVGLLGPVLFYFHSTSLGYAFLLWLSVLFLANLALALFAPAVVGSSSKAYAKIWMVTHVLASVLIVLLTAVHAYVASWF